MEDEKKSNMHEGRNEREDGCDTAGARILPQCAAGVAMQRHNVVQTQPCMSLNSTGAGRGQEQSAARSWCTPLLSFSKHLAHLFRLFVAKFMLHSKAGRLECIRQTSFCVDAMHSLLSWLQAPCQRSFKNWRSGICRNSHGTKKSHYLGNVSCVESEASIDNEDDHNR